MNALGGGGLITGTSLALLDTLCEGVSTSPPPRPGSRMCPPAVVWAWWWLASLLDESSHSRLRACPLPACREAALRLAGRCAWLFQSTTGRLCCRPRGSRSSAALPPSTAFGMLRGAALALSSSSLLGGARPPTHQSCYVPPRACALWVCAARVPRWLVGIGWWASSPAAVFDFGHGRALLHSVCSCSTVPALSIVWHLWLQAGAHLRFFWPGLLRCPGVQAAAARLDCMLCI
jgi:hypothetical protein